MHNARAGSGDVGTAAHTMMSLLKKMRNGVISRSWFVDSFRCFLAARACRNLSSSMVVRSLPNSGSLAIQGPVQAVDVAVIDDQDKTASGELFSRPPCEHKVRRWRRMVMAGGM